MFLTVFPLFMPKSESLPTLFKKELLSKEQRERFGLGHQKRDREGITPIALYKRATVSDLPPLLMTKERRERFALFHELIALSLSKNKRFTPKTDESIPNPGKYIFILLIF